MRNASILAACRLAGKQCHRIGGMTREMKNTTAISPAAVGTNQTRRLAIRARMRIPRGSDRHPGDGREPDQFYVSNWTSTFVGVMAPNFGV